MSDYAQICADLRVCVAGGLCDDCSRSTGETRTDCIEDLMRASIKAIETMSAESERKKVSASIYDKEEILQDCTVQILTSTVTGDVSVGWWRNEGESDE